MTDFQALLEPLQSQLQQELHLTKQFLDVLQEEAHILETGQPDDLSRATSAKEKVAQALQLATHERATLLSSFNVPSNLQGLRTVGGHVPELAPLVEELGALSEKAQRMNEQNGATINALLINTQRMMAA